jgi:RHH-type transcriptional regulator, rel operon repressor / antitoxin RelB
MYSIVEEQRMLALRLPPDIEKRLDKLAAKTGRTKSFYAREAILSYIEDLEDTYLARARLEHPKRRWSLEELARGDDLAR